MAYTTALLVGTVIPVKAGDDPAFAIDSAHHLVSKFCEGSDYTTQEKELIEWWLAAHFYAMLRPRRNQEQAGGVGQTFEPLRVDLRLNLTKFGQHAMVLDYAGNLAALNKRLETGVIPIGTTWLGTPPEGA